MILWKFCASISFLNVRKAETFKAYLKYQIQIDLALKSHFLDVMCELDFYISSAME